MIAPPIAYLKASMYRSKGLENPGRAKTGAKHNNYFSFRPNTALPPKSAVFIAIKT